MSDSKQKSTLASLAQKKKSVQKFKTILSQPFPKYLPKIQLEDINDIKELIIKDKQEYNQKNYKKYRGILTGLNSIIRLLKNNQISCLLLSSNIKPFSILYQIITLALTTGQPSPYILYVPNLNEILREIFHIDSLAMACTKGKFIKLEEYMEIKCLEFPIPEKFLIYHGLLKQNQPQAIKKIVKENQTDKVNFNELYIIKSHAYSSRSFYPKNTNNLKPLQFEEPQDFTGDYISLSNAEDEKTQSDFINNTIDYKTDKQNLINVIKTHLCNVSIPTKEQTSSLLDSHKEKLCKKRKIEKKKNIIETRNQFSMIQYEPLKIKKIQGNFKKKKIEKKKLK